MTWSNSLIDPHMALSKQISKHLVKIYLRVLFAIFLFIFSGCQLLAEDSTEAALRDISTGRILVWHSFGEDGGPVMDELIANYRSVYPSISVIAVHVDQNELKDRFMRTAALGLGPDIVIGSNDWLLSLIDQDLIDPISSNEIDAKNLDLAKFNPAALELATFTGNLYALPLSIQAPVLYTNRDLIDNVPGTYDALIETASNGQLVAISTDPRTAFLGIEAFGPSLLNLEPSEDDMGSIQLNPEGFIAWVTWLKDAQENPNIILSQDEETLGRLFFEGDVATYLGPYQRPAEFSTTSESNQLTNVSINSVPKTEMNISRPLIKASLIYFNKASSARQRNIALDFSTFLTNSEQGNFLLRELKLTPANRRVPVDRRVYPFVYAFSQSGRTAVALPRQLEPAIVGPPASTAYTAILSGAQEPEDAFCDWQIQIEAAWDGPFIGADFCEEQ